MLGTVLLLHVWVSTTSTTTSACEFTLPDPSHVGECKQWSFCNVSAHQSVAHMIDQPYMDEYLVAPPFGAVDLSDCAGSSCNSKVSAAAYQVYPGSLNSSSACPRAPPHASWSCYTVALSNGGPRGVLAETLPPPRDGVRLTYGGGDGNRGLVYEVDCSPGQPLQPASANVSFSRGGGFSTEYTVQWHGDVGCGKAVSSCPPPPPLPQPTAAQLSWQKNEIMALVHFNMATFFRNGDPGCDASNWHASKDPRSFAPDSLNVSQWIVSMKALGVSLLR